MPIHTTITPATEPVPSGHSIPVRYAFTLAMNVTRLALMSAAMLVVARGMTPAQYGDMNFLLGTFAAALPLLELGTSSAFYTILSKSRQAAAFFRYYAYWLAAQILLQAAAVAFLFPGPLVKVIWLNNPKATILVALLASFTSLQLWTAAQQLGEAARETVFVQRIRAGITGLYLLLVVALIQGGQLTIITALLALSVSNVAGCAYFAFRFRWGLVVDGFARVETLRDYAGKFYIFCAPLVLSSLTGAAAQFADKWLLQYFGGAEEQGYFSLGAQFSAIALLGTSSFIAIFWKEIAHADSSGNPEKVARLFLKSVKTLYFFSSAIACFLLPLAPLLVPLLLGAEYREGAAPFAIMLFYPTMQSMGQLIGTYFIATGRTGWYLVFSLAGLAAGVPLAWFFLAPFPGLALGASGLAYKSVLFLVVIINFQGYVACRLNGWKWPMLHQLVTPVLLSGFAWLTFSLVPVGGLTGAVEFAGLAAYALLFSAFAAWLAFKVPWLTGVSAEDIKRYAKAAREFLGGHMRGQNG